MPSIAFVRALAVAVVFGLAGCESVRTWTPGFLRPYRPDVQQGNVVTREMVDQLRPGMTREQVRFLLGTPLLTSLFHQDRWDYVYRLARGTGEVQTRKLVVFFKNHRLERFESDEMPTEALADNLILGGKAKAAQKPPQAPAAPVEPPAS